MCRKKKLVKLATMIAWTPAVERSSVDKWVHDDGRVLILSDAAHVFFPCSIQNLAVAVCDATTLDHLFLNAFQEIRPERIRSMHTLELSNIDFSLMPNGPAQEARDESLKERRDKELNALDFIGSKEGDNKEEMDISMRL
ncbi:hypothetical protein EUX98_g2409 [Antrodiella citrinella]|uniref:FAD-binding domain-containing protein n=1 Tax=Antrodiella citrinella TaxID=2447956 RepID=A0A4S4MZ62_9APHY|nr:hypothetical protein EUX98_g2409 [Antrodiella citrinella]